MPPPVLIGLREVLQAPRTWLAVHISFPHKKQDASVVIRQRFKLLGEGSTSNVEDKQKDSNSGGNARTDFQDRSFLM